MKIIFLLCYSVVQTTIIQGKKIKNILFFKNYFISALNQYLGCFIDQIGNRDLSGFIDDDEQLTPKQCILKCHEQNLPYAAIQYRSECRCGQQYGKYGQVSDDECNYRCSTSEKCGGDNRNSVYSVINSIDTYKTGLLRRIFIRNK
jgi:hypothetical protein